MKPYPWVGQSTSLLLPVGCESASQTTILDYINFTETEQMMLLYTHIKRTWNSVFVGLTEL